MCGGTRFRSANHFCHAGLSPRVRGNRPPTTGAAPASGSIPACAGEPAGGAKAGARTGVYPRVCGGTAVVPVAGDIDDGLSPRVRGNQLPESSPSVASGSIPACAGEPTSAAHRRARGRVYPRVCGGTRFGLAGRGLCHGLSPRVRGNRMGRRIAAMPHRSIPACAGEPNYTTTPVTAKAVYPRVCGGTLDC